MPRPSRIAAALALVALLTWAGSRSFLIVDETEFVLVNEFGRTVAVLGDEPGEAGLHLIPPWRSALAIDRRLQVAEPSPREVITRDKRNLEVAPFLAWRVADPARFLRAAGTLDAAADRLDERVAAAINDAVAGMSLENLASTDPAAWKLDRLTDDVLRSVAAQAREELGVELVDVRLRRFNHPVEVRPAVFDLIRSERAEEAARLRAEGEAEYLRITSAAERNRDETLARAEAEAARVEADGEARATRILNAVHARDPRFYEFLRTLEAYGALLDGKATIVLSASSPLLRLLNEGPPDTLLGVPVPSPGPTASGEEARP
jgi:membrane protease subunit HflC